MAIFNIFAEHGNYHLSASYTGCSLIFGSTRPAILLMEATMRAVKGKNGILSILNRDEASLFNNVDMMDFLDISTLSERDHHIAETLHQKNVLQKIKRGDKLGYKIYPQREKL